MKIGIASFAIVAVLAVGAGVVGIRAFTSRRAVAHAADGSEAGPGTAGESGRRPVLVELFTSEGCSSCPPADQVLSRLQEEQPVAGAEIITMSEHVDYWNHLGWKDPYSDALFTKRQDDYANAFHIDGMYTPEMVVDGSSEFVGSDAGKARSEIAKAALRSKADVEIQILPDSQGGARLPVRIKVESAQPLQKPADVVLAVTESGLRSSVARGENEGKTLSHTSVVREWKAAGSIPPGARIQFDAKVTASIKPSWNRKRLKLVALVQERDTRRVVGVAAIAISPNE